MKIKIVLILVFLSLITFNCKEKGEVDSVISLITVEEMDTLIKTKGIVLIDVRTPEEYSQGYIEGAVNIDYKDSDFENLISKIDKSKPVAIYCRSGVRSGKSAVLMKKLGFAKVYDLKGGILKWNQSSKPIVKK